MVEAVTFKAWSTRHNKRKKFNMFTITMTGTEEYYGCFGDYNVRMCGRLYAKGCRLCRVITRLNSERHIRKV